MNTYHLTVSVGQELGRGSAEGLHLGDSHMVELKMSGWPQPPEGRLGPEDGSPAWFSTGDLLLLLLAALWRLRSSTNGPLHRIA